MQPIEQSYNREKKALHGHNLQREHDTGGTPARTWHRRHAGANMTPAARRRDHDTGGTPAAVHACIAGEIVVK